MMSKFIFVVCLSLLMANVSYAQELQSFVSDQASIFTEIEKNQLEQSLRKYEQETSTEIAVFSIETLGEESLEDYAFNLANRLGLGKVDKNNGVLILVAKKERKIRLELGVGANRYISNEQASIIIDEQMVPHFREGNFYAGIEAALQEIYRLLGNHFND